MLDKRQIILKSIRRHAKVLLAIFAIWIWLPILVGFGEYDGVCEHMLDGSSPCTYSAYLRNNMIWLGVVLVIPLPIIMGIFGWNSGLYLAYTNQVQILDFILPFTLALSGSFFGFTLTALFPELIYRLLSAIGI